MAGISARHVLSVSSVSPAGYQLEKLPVVNMKPTINRRTPPGDLAIWIFIMAELLVFAIFFATYAFTRAGHVELFNQYQLTLDRNLALINTLALITSIPARTSASP